MAASSMHKPGWRSRRRSRLSLVERAVPRLGRVSTPDDGSKTTKAEEALNLKQLPASSEHLPGSQGQSLAEFETKTTPSPLNDAASLIPTQGMSAANRDDAPSPAAPESAEEPALASVQIEHAGDPVAPGDETPAESTVPFLLDTLLDAEVLEADVGALSQEVPPTTAASVDLAMATGDASETDSSEGMDAAHVTPVLPVPVTVSSKAAADDATDEIATRPNEQASPTLELDWGRLIESGFIDPRDRGRPLPRHMDDIIRALIRQALSDQSSWRDRVILVTSPGERTSKTTAAINFAFGLTTVGSHHAVLVDVDTTGIGAVDRLGGESVNGIAAVLADESIEIGDLVIETDLDRLTLVASGASDEDTLDRFASRRTLQILRYLTENPETLLVIDAPPILASQEAAVLSVIAGQVVLAVEAGRTTADQIEHALQRIGDRHNVSLVLNESSGIVVEDRPSVVIASRHESSTASRRAPSTKRRLAKAAVAAVALGLFALLPAGHASPKGIVSAPVSVFSKTAAVPPERWSVEIGMTVAPYRLVGR
ncbi:MAG: hypothetical protein ACR2P3_11655 [Geminicoccaceae bacterium]